MLELSDKQFDQLIAEAIDAIPPLFQEHLQNVAFIIEDEPTPEQRMQLKLYPYETLFGLYEGVPLPARNGMSKILPDKITIFKTPALNVSRSIDELKEHLRHTVWHEVAHYYGLNHKRIHELEDKGKGVTRAADSFRARRDEGKP
jgi:predicted Zn-dependent protease with MMP-like domain